MYCTELDVRAALTSGASPEDAESAASLPSWQIEDAIREAQGTVDVYVRSRYVVALETLDLPVDPNADPVVTVPTEVAKYPIRGWTRNVAAWLATLTFRKSHDIGEDDPVRQRYNMTMKMLESIRDRSADLADFQPAVTGDDQGVHVENLYEGHLFDQRDFDLYPEGVNPQYLWPVRR